MNQCPHNLDLIQWFVGMPNKVTANVGIGNMQTTIWGAWPDLGLDAESSFT